MTGDGVACFYQEWDCFDSQKLFEQAGKASGVFAKLKNDAPAAAHFALLDA